ncbi:MAG: hypothetical protein K8W52_43820 [Deltaproteobacteria bacterium]|nr:hypothetical protein [Deltaproteobacteria bacterium]
MRLVFVMIATVVAGCGGGGDEPRPDATAAVDAGVDAVVPDAPPVLGALGDACDVAGACASGFCADGVCCDSACDGACAACGSDGACAATTGDTCRAAAGGCDVAEVCDGASQDCPTDGLADIGTVCGDYVCTGAVDCPAACTVVTDCAVGAACRAGTCAPVKWAFTTSTTINGNTGGLAGADAFCQARATAAGLPGTYMAWMATDAASPSTRFTRATVPYVMPAGNGVVVTLADDWADLTDGTIDAFFNRNELGAVVASNIPWTNVKANGTVYMAGGDCVAWTSTGSGQSGWSGYSDTPDQGWTQNTTTTCNILHRLFCFQQ